MNHGGCRASEGGGITAGAWHQRVDESRPGAGHQMADESQWVNHGRCMNHKSQGGCMA